MIRTDFHRKNRLSTSLLNTNQQAKINSLRQLLSLELCQNIKVPSCKNSSDFRLHELSRG